MFESASWITAPIDCGRSCPLFETEYRFSKEVKRAELSVSAVGLYILHVNGASYSFGLFNPGWTNYAARIQYQTYDVTASVQDAANISILGAGGWATANLLLEGEHFFSDRVCVIAELRVTYCDGTEDIFSTDENWQVFRSPVLYSHIYNGETIDCTAEKTCLGNAVRAEIGSRLVPQEGVPIKEHERLPARQLLITPEGDRVIDFGQNLSGYVEIRVNACKGSRIRNAEVLDQNGNFYTKNLRTAKQTMEYVLGEDGEQILKPFFTTQGFRYIAVDEFPGEIDPACFTSVAVYADMMRTGYFSCGNETINRLYNCILWTHRSNFMEVPTDCPQRDERHGWLGDAQLFCKAAAYSYDVYAFYRKWLHDVASQQLPSGAIRSICPFNDAYDFRFSAAWSDAVVIIPWELYRIYGDKTILEDQFTCMRRWVDYMHSAGSEEFLWLGGNHYGDWLALDGPDPREPLTDKDFIGSAFFAYSARKVVECGRVLGRDMSEYAQLAENVREAFRARYVVNGLPATDTMTGCILLLHFGLAEESEKEKIVEHLLQLLARFDNTLCTGLLGTAYILHVLSENGRAKQAYDLLLQKKFPSWLGMLDYGATTIWERFDTIDENGIKDVRNASLNHYVYGTILDWLVEGAVGLRSSFDHPGYTKINWRPLPDSRFGHAEFRFETPCGRIECSWQITDSDVQYRLCLPDAVGADVRFPDGQNTFVTGGTHTFTSRLPA
ncbi:MAG: glycoside hydrolase family 78 protein [Clostridia bacterium]|nr:glycoside hydrolase family 78 protein [Clostridia bacterium]